MFFTSNKKQPHRKGEAVNQSYLFDSNVQLLPGLIENISDVETSCFLIQRLADAGMEKIVLSIPISDQRPYSLQVIRASYDAVCRSLIDRKVEIELMLAGQYRIDRGFMSLVKKNDIISMGDKYILFDLPLDGEPAFIENIIFELEVNGYKPVLVHPERYEYYHQPTLKRYRKLKSLGCFFQLNPLSIAGHYGERIKRVAQKLLKERMIDTSGAEVNSERQVELLIDFIKGEYARSPEMKELLKRGKLL